jgi:predicted Zn-dependent protease
MKKTAIIVACILALITLVSCQDKGYDAKTEEAQNLYNNGKILPAIRLLDEAIEKNDFKYEAYAMRGYFYWQLGNFECAVSDYKNAIKRGGKYYNYPLGKLFIDIGRPLDAVEYMNDYIKYDKNNPQVYVLLANIYQQSGDTCMANYVRDEGYEATGDEMLKKPAGTD